MKLSRQETAEWLKRRVNAVKAERGLSWTQIAERLSTREGRVTPGSLMSKHSRSSFTAIELIVLLQAMDVPMLELPTNRPTRHPARAADSDNTSL